MLNTQCSWFHASNNAGLSFFFLLFFLHWGNFLNYSKFIESSLQNNSRTIGRTVFMKPTTVDEEGERNFFFFHFFVFVSEPIERWPLWKLIFLSIKMNFFIFIFLLSFDELRLCERSYYNYLFKKRKKNLLFFFRG